mmetsp:Transcript_3567/g.4771  ORF Transcript_3567/g.4771 Transcript_3567/m.4771 type:complete len:161 (+) Transcript_3567:110-592(+)|eukprot:jgi/Bigna1/91396/estExt_fgenesh1_pg.C_990052
MGQYFGKKVFERAVESKFEDFTLKDVKTHARVLSVYDGDTCTLGFKWLGKYFKVKVRMYGYDSPEMRPRKNQENREEEIKAAKLAKEYLIGVTKDQILWAHFLDFDKYGRPLVTLYLNQYMFCCLGNNKENINEMMVESGHGYPYKGGTKKKFVATEKKV